MDKLQFLLLIYHRALWVQLYTEWVHSMRGAAHREESLTVGLLKKFLKGRVFWEKIGMGPILYAC